MYTVKGKFAKALITNEQTDKNAVKQIKNILNQPIAKNTHIVEQPDQHFGAGVPIGTSIRLDAPKKDWKISPTIISGDIGCGVLAIKIKEYIKESDLPKLDQIVSTKIPTTPIAPHFHPNVAPPDANFSKRIAKSLDMPIGKHIKHDLLYDLGTLGSGNHFIEFDKDKQGNDWLVIHCGSRHVGTDVLKYYMRMTGSEQRHKLEKKQLALVSKYKQAGKQQQIEAMIKKFKKVHPIIIGQYSYLTGESMNKYLHDTRLVQQFAVRNRHIIARKILAGMGYHKVDQIESIHNYFNFTDHVMRKGAVTAHKNERLIIPLNMRDGSLLCIGRGNKNWNWTAPHGAGRALPRHVAKEKLSMCHYQAEMNGIYTSSLTPYTLDEAPEAYKPMQQIIDNITPTAKIIERFKPIYSYKAH